MPEGEELEATEYYQHLYEKMDLLEIPRAFTSRSVNEGFSGGEKKRCEILQMAMLEPKYAILDETDSGLDIDALKIVSAGVNALRGPDLGILLITHYQRLLDYIVPDYVHVMVQGRIVLQRRKRSRARTRGERLRLGRKKKNRQLHKSERKNQCLTETPTIDIDRSVGDFHYDMEYTLDAGVGLSETTIRLHQRRQRKIPTGCAISGSKRSKVFEAKPMPTHWASKDLENIDLRQNPLLPLARAHRRAASRGTMCRRT